MSTSPRNPLAQDHLRGRMVQGQGREVFVAQLYAPNVAAQPERALRAISWSGLFGVIVASSTYRSLRRQPLLGQAWLRIRRMKAPAERLPRLRHLSTQ